MSYSVVFTSSAARDLRRLPEDVRRRVVAALQGLANDPRPPGCVKLSGGDEWRIRVGDYRVVYRVDDTARQVTVTRIGHRRDVYR